VSGREVPELCVHANVAVGEVFEPCVGDNVAVGEVPEPCRKHSCRCCWDPADVSLLPQGAEDHRRHGRTRGAIITCYRDEPDGTPVLFLVA
jgi:hypothetical protein